MEEDLEKSVAKSKNLQADLKSVIKYGLISAGISGAYLLCRNLGIIPDNAEWLLDWKFNKLDALCYFNTGVGIGIASISYHLKNRLSH